MFSIVIPNYNGKELLKQCLDSITQASFKSAEGMEIIIVDNGSGDGSRKYLGKLGGLGRSGGRKRSGGKKKSISLKTIFNKKNLGFARAVNQGARAAKNDYLAVMNNDVKIKSDWLAVMAGAIKRWEKKKRVGCFCGLVLTRDGKKIESAGLAYEVKGKALNRGNGERSGFQNYRREEVVFGASAAAVVYRREAFLSVGGFDEDFFAYLEDVDLSLRLNGRGWKTVYIPEAVSFHRGGATSDKMKGLRRRADIRNWWFIIIKNYPLSIIVKYGPQIFLERLRNLSGLIKEGGWGSVPAALKAYLAVGRSLPKMIGKRKSPGKNIFVKT